MHTYQGDTYFTVHVTPQTECSWVSFETNLEKESYSSLISQVLSLFRPGKCAVSLFASKVSKYACTQVAVASSPVSPIFFNARDRKEGEPGKRSHVKRIIND